jgi:hypothetical protein
MIFYGKRESADAGGIALLGFFALIVLVNSLLSLEYVLLSRRLKERIVELRSKKPGSFLKFGAYCMLIVGTGFILAGVKYADPLNMMYTILLDVSGSLLVIASSFILKHSWFADLKCSRETD